VSREFEVGSRQSVPYVAIFVLIVCHSDAVDRSGV